MKILAPDDGHPDELQRSATQAEIVIGRRSISRARAYTEADLRRQHATST